MTAEQRTARLAARTLRVRSSGPAAAIAAVSSAALVGAAVFAFNGAGPRLDASRITGDVPGVPGVVQAIAAPSTSASSNPFVRHPVSPTGTGVGVVVTPTGQPAAGGPARRPVTPPTGAPSGPAAGPSVRPPSTHTGTPGVPSPTNPHGKPHGKPSTPPGKPTTSTPTPSTPSGPIVVDFTDQQVKKATRAVKTRVSTSLSIIAGPLPQDQLVVKKVSQRLDHTLDTAVTAAMNVAANAALDDAVKASQANASPGEIRLVAAASFQSALPNALRASVTPVVTAAVQQIAPDSTAGPAVALVAGSAALSASPEVAQQSTSTVVQAVTESVTDPATSGPAQAGLAAGPSASPTTPPPSTTTPSPTTSAAPAPSTTSSTTSAAQPDRAASPARAAAGQPAGRRAPSHQAPARGHDEKARTQGPAHVEKKRPTKASGKGPMKAAKKGQHAGARTIAKHRAAGHASHDEARQHTPGRHRA